MKEAYSVSAPLGTLDIATDDFKDVLFINYGKEL
jgi:hypothetical protein